MSESKEVIVKGKQLTCPVCGGKKFRRKIVLLNTRLMTMLNMDWANNDAINYICHNCSYIFWFEDTGEEYIENIIREKQEIVVSCEYEKDDAEQNECPNCFAKVSENEEECSNCGYKLK